EPRSLWIPLIPADEHAELGGVRRERAKPEIPGREVELLVVARLVRNVHFPVLADVPPLRVEPGRGVVVTPGRAPLEQARDDRDVERRRELPGALGRRTGHGLGEREIRDVLRLAEVARPKE